LNFFAIIFLNPISSSDIDMITHKIKKVKNVIRIYEISGHHRLAVFMVAQSYSELKKIINKQLIPIGLEDEEIITVLEADTEFISPLEIP